MRRALRFPGDLAAAFRALRQRHGEDAGRAACPYHAPGGICLECDPEVAAWK